MRTRCLSGEFARSADHQRYVRELGLPVAARRSPLRGLDRPGRVRPHHRPPRDDLTTMLAHLWTTEYAEPVRTGMRHQAWRHRIGTGFPHDDVTVAGKTGTLGRLRHEMAVIEYHDEVPVAVVILARSLRPQTHQPRVDSAIGVIARLAVNRLRRSTQSP